MPLPEPQTEPPPFPPQRPPNHFAVAGWCLGIYFLLSLLGIVALATNGRDGVRFAPSAAERFLSRLEEKNYAAAYQRLTVQARRTRRAEKFTTDLAALQKRRGRLIGHAGPTPFQAEVVQGIMQVRLDYQENFANGNAIPVHLLLICEDGTWKVASFDFSTERAHKR